MAHDFIKKYEFILSMKYYSFKIWIRFKWVWIYYYLHKQCMFGYVLVYLIPFGVRRLTNKIFQSVFRWLLIEIWTTNSFFLSSQSTTQDKRIYMVNDPMNDPPEIWRPDQRENAKRWLYVSGIAGVFKAILWLNETFIITFWRLWLFECAYLLKFLLKPCMISF